MGIFNAPHDHMFPGKVKEDLILTPLAVRSANVGKPLETRRGLLRGMCNVEADESFTAFQSKELNTTVQVDFSQSEEDWYEGKTLLEKLVQHR